MSGISTHVLDTWNGKPAAGVVVTLDCADGSGGWDRLGSGVTDADGRCSALLGKAVLGTASYRLTFYTQDYFEAGLYPEITVTFSVRNTDQHYHIPLLLGQHTYTTYRGS